jgi:hypothetical protein
MFAALLILAASTLFLVEHRDERIISSLAVRSTSIEPESEAPEDAYYVLCALWSASIALAVVLFSMTHIALLNRSLDKPKTLVVSSRWVRLAPRIPVIVVIVCLPLIKNLNGSSWCGGAVVVLYLLFTWEWLAGLEKNWTFFEPKDE